MIDANIFRQAMSRLGASVNLITTDGPGGLYGMTASAVCSVTDTPPTVLVCVNRSSLANECIKKNGVVGVNILAGRHEHLSNLFGSSKASIEERFINPDDWQTLETGAPLLKDASAALDCKVTEMSEVGTHTVFFCEVQSAVLHDECATLVYFNRAYHRLT